MKVILIMIVSCIFLIWLWYCLNMNSYTKIININWGIDLPSYWAKEIYSYSEPSFHGDGIRYHIIDYPIWNDSKKMQNASFSLEKIFYKASLPTDNQISYVNEILDKIVLKENMVPDFKRCFVKYLKQDDNSELFLFYSHETWTLYIVESFL